MHRSSFRWRLVAAVTALLAVAALGAGCSSDESTLALSDFWVAFPTVPERCGAFGVITNNGTTAVDLISASVPSTFADEVQLHEVVMVDGAAKMQPISGVTIEPGAQLVLKSGSYHLMLLNPRVEVGQQVPLTLNFSDGTTLKLDVTVKEAMPPATSSTMGG